MSDRAYLDGPVEPLMTPVDPEDPAAAAPSFWRDIGDNSPGENVRYLKKTPIDFINRLNLLNCTRCKCYFTDFTVMCCKWSVDDLIQNYQKFVQKSPAGPH